MVRRVYLIGTSWTSKRAFAQSACGSDILAPHSTEEERSKPRVADIHTLGTEGRGVLVGPWPHCPLVILTRSTFDISDADAVIVCLMANETRRIGKAIGRLAIPTGIPVDVCVLTTPDAPYLDCDYSALVGCPVGVHVGRDIPQGLLSRFPICATSDLQLLWKFVAYLTKSNLCSPTVLSGRTLLITKGPYALRMESEPSIGADSATELYALADRVDNILEFQTPHAEFPVWVVHSKGFSSETCSAIRSRETIVWLGKNAPDLGPWERSMVVCDGGVISMAGWEMSSEEERRKDDPEWTKFVQWVHKW